MQQKFFDHFFYPKRTLTRLDKPEGRVYITPEGNEYPSVTTVISNSSLISKEKLKVWREAIGDIEADKIVTQSKNRGQALHDILEKYMINDPLYDKGEMPVNLESFGKIQPYLNKYITMVYGIEYPLYSDFLRTAGTTDLICDWDGVKSIFDLKTSRKFKKEDDILGYFIQATCYALMYNQMLNDVWKNVKQIVIAIIIDDEEPQIFVKPISDYLSLMLKVFMER